MYAGDSAAELGLLDGSGDASMDTEADDVGAGVATKTDVAGVADGAGEEASEREGGDAKKEKGVVGLFGLAETAEGAIFLVVLDLAAGLLVLACMRMPSLAVGTFGFRGLRVAFGFAAASTTLASLTSLTFGAFFGLGGGEGGGGGAKSGFTTSITPLTSCSTTNSRNPLHTSAPQDGPNNVGSQSSRRSFEACGDTSTTVSVGKYTRAKSDFAEH
jgi:hypothetical protein